jgi:hypothetical protein
MQLRLKSYSEWRRKLLPTDTRWWLLWAVGVRWEVQRDPVWDVAIYWKRLLAVVVLLVAVSYAGGVTALHLWWARQPETRVDWTDIALAPLDRQKFRELRGDRMIALGRAKAESGRLVEAVFDLQAGLARSPENLEGRLTLIRVWALLDRVRALRVTEDGLRRQPEEPQLLAALFELYALVGADAKALEASAALLRAERQPPLPAVARRVVVNARAALLLPTQPEEALRLLESVPDAAGLRDEQRSLRLKLQALTRLGRTADAAALFAQVPRDATRDPRVDAELAIAAGDAAAFETALRRLKVESKSPVMASLLAIRGWHELKRPTFRAAAVVEFVRFHSGDERALQALGALAVELELPLLLLRAEQEAAAHRFNPFAFHVHQTELALRQGDLDEAQRRLPKWESTLADLPEQQRDVPELLARLLRVVAVNGETQSAALVAHLQRCGPRLGSSFFKLAMETLERQGRVTTAAEVADLGARFLPLNDALQREQVRLAERAAQQKIAEARMGAAAASPAPADARDEPDVSRFADGAAAVAAVDEALAAPDAARALRIIHRVQRASPPWLGEIEPALAVREYRARRAQGEMPSAMIAFRGLVLKPGLPRAAAFRLVRDLIAEGEGETALQLAREIVRLVPGERAAAVLLKEAESAVAPPESATPTSQIESEKKVGPASAKL